MTKRRNKKTTVAKRFGAVLLAVLMLVAAVPNTTTVYAATNVVVARNNEEPKTLGNITIQVSNAAVNEKVGNEDIPINGMNVATAAAVDENGATYVLWLSGTLYLYSYKYQGKNGDSVPIAYGVDEIKEDGYYSGKTRYNYLTDSEVKQKLGITDNNNNGNNGNNSNNNGNNTSNNKIGAYMVGNDIVFYNDGINTYPLSIGQTVSEIAESNGVVYIRYPNGEIKSWATSNKTNLNLNTVAVNARSIYKVNGIVAGYYDKNGKISSFTNSANASETQYLNFQNGKVMLLIMQNGNIVKAYTLSDKNNKWASQDANNTCYVRKDNGDLYIWNYDLQKTESSVKLIKIASNVKDAIETKSNNDKKLLIGYTIEGSSAMQQALKLDDVKIKVAMAKVDNTANPTTDTNVTYAGRVVVKNSYTFLYNSNNEKVAKMKWNNKSKTLKYWNLKTNQTIKVKNVSSKRDYSLTGNPVFIKQNGEVFGISSKTMQVVRIGVGAVKFRHNAYGFATHYFSKGNQKSKIYF